MKKVLIVMAVLLAVIHIAGRINERNITKENVYAEQAETEEFEDKEQFQSNKTDEFHLLDTDNSITEESAEEIEGNELVDADDTADAAEISKKLRTYDFYRDEEKTVFLTFDDGAATTITPKILDVLQEYDVKATFFVIGDTVEKGGDKAKEIVKRMYEEEHSIGNHTYSHQYSYLYPNRTLNLQNFLSEIDKTEQLLQDILGEEFSTRIVRCPGGSMSWNNMNELFDKFKEIDKVSIDWNALSKDAEGQPKNADELLANVKETSKGIDTVVLLMHDTYGKEETVKALPGIIEYFKENGFTFKTLV